MSLKAYQAPKLSVDIPNTMMTDFTSLESYQSSSQFIFHGNREGNSVNTVIRQECKLACRPL